MQLIVSGRKTNRTKTVRMRTRKPEATRSVLRNDFRRVGWALRTAVIGEGEAAFGVTKRAGGREKSFCRDTVPSRIVGRFKCDEPSLLNSGPGKEDEREA